MSDRNSGECPFCGSKETDFSIITISDGMGYCDIWCNTCKHACHISRMNTDRFQNENKKIPKGLKYWKTTSVFENYLSEYAVEFIVEAFSSTDDNVLVNEVTAANQEVGDTKCRWLCHRRKFWKT